MNTAEFWVLLAFLFFILLFGKKCYVIICEMLDEYINKVKNDIDSAEKSNSDSQKLLDDAKKDGSSIQSRIDDMQNEYDKQINELQELYNSSITEFEKLSEKNLQNDIKFELESAKKRIINNIEKNVATKLKENFRNKKFDIEILKNNIPTIKEFLK